jgi:hypothetical protein
MSTLRTNNVQVGQSPTATNNFTLYQPSVPDGTVRLGVGNTGATSADVITANSSGNVGIGTSSPLYKFHVQLPASGVGAVFRYLGGTNNPGLFFSTNESTAVSQIDASGSISGILALATSGTERARIDSTGQQSSVIPGGSTLYPEYKCRAWVNFNGTGTVAIRASGNVSSITDNGTGDYTVNFATAMPDANYNCVSTAVQSSTPTVVNFAPLVGTDSDTALVLYSTTQVRLNARRSGTTLNDSTLCSVAIFR